MRDAPTIVVREEALVVGAWRDLLVYHWLGPASAELHRRSNDVIARLAAARADGKIAILTVVDAPRITLPDAAMRREIASAVTRLEGSKKAEALVVRTEGMVAAAVRSITAGAMLLRTTPSPTRVAATVQDACTWLASYLGPVGGRLTTVEEIDDAVRQILATR